jgi:hypothetical protein
LLIAEEALIHRLIESILVALGQSVADVLPIGLSSRPELTMKLRPILMPDLMT